MLVVGVAVSFYGLAAFQDHEGVALGCGFGGAVLATMGAFGGDEPVDESGARRLADDHNRRLKQRLGLPPALDRDPSQQPVMRGWHVSGLVTPGGGGALALRLDF